MTRLIGTKSGRAWGTKENAQALNAYLDTLQVKVYETHREMIDAKEEVTAEKLKNKLHGKEIEKSKMLLEVFLEHNQQKEIEIVRGEYAEGIKTRFETANRHTKAFLKAKYGVEDIPINNLDW